MKNLDDIGAFYAGADNDPSAVTLSKDFVERYAKNWKAHSLCDFINRCKTFSMLHQETLLVLNFFSRRAKGAILEIGAYTGAATVALAQGVKDGGKGNALVTIEAGGAYAHSEIPSDDIVVDLQKNLAAFGLSDAVTIVEQWSDRRPAIKASRQLLAPESVDLLVIDADGYVNRDFWIYEPLLADGCVLVIDDYESDVSPEKKKASEYMGQSRDLARDANRFWRISMGNMDWAVPSSVECPASVVSFPRCALLHPEHRELGSAHSYSNLAVQAAVGQNARTATRQTLSWSVQKRLPIDRRPSFQHEETGMEDEKARNKRAIYARWPF